MRIIICEKTKRVMRLELTIFSLVNWHISLIYKALRLSANLGETK